MIVDNFLSKSSPDKQYSKDDFIGIANKDAWSIKHASDLIGCRKPPAEDDPYPAGTQVEFTTPDGTNYRGVIASKSGEDYIVDIQPGESYLLPIKRFSKVTPDSDKVREAMKREVAPQIKLLNENTVSGIHVVKIAYAGHQPNDDQLKFWASEHFPELPLLDAVVRGDQIMDLVFKIDQTKQAAEDVKPQSSAPKMPGERGRALSSEEIEGTGIIAASDVYAEVDVIAEPEAETEIDYDTLLAGATVEMKATGDPVKATDIAYENLIKEPEYYKNASQTISLDDVLLSKDVSKEAQLGQPGAGDQYNDLVRAARWVLTRFNNSNPEFYAIPQENEMAGDGENRVVRLSFSLSKKNDDELLDLFISRSGAIVTEASTDAKPLRGFIQVDSEGNLPLVMLVGPTGPQAAQEYGFGLTASNYVSGFTACMAEADTVLSTHGGYTAEAQAEFDARLTKLAIDDTAKKYWSGYLKDYGKAFTRDIPRKEHKTAQKYHPEADSFMIEYWTNYWGGSMFDDGWYGEQMLKPVQPSKAPKKTASRVASDYTAYIKKTDSGEYEVKSEKNPKWSGGTYKSKDEAKKRLQQVEMFKHMSALDMVDAAMEKIAVNWGNKQPTGEYLKPDLKNITKWAIDIAQKDPDVQQAVTTIVHDYIRIKPQIMNLIEDEYGSRTLDDRANAFILTYAINDSNRAYKQLKKLIHGYESRWKNPRWKQLDEQRKLFHEQQTEKMKQPAQGVSGYITMQVPQQDAKVVEELLKSRQPKTADTMTKEDWKNEQKRQKELLKEQEGPASSQETRPDVTTTVTEDQLIAAEQEVEKLESELEEAKKEYDADRKNVIKQKTRDELDTKVKVQKSKLWKMNQAFEDQKKSPIEKIFPAGPLPEHMKPLFEAGGTGSGLTEKEWGKAYNRWNKIIEHTERTNPSVSTLMETMEDWVPFSVPDKTGHYAKYYKMNLKDIFFTDPSYALQFIKDFRPELVKPFLEFAKITALGHYDYKGKFRPTREFNQLLKEQVAQALARKEREKARTKSRQDVERSKKYLQQSPADLLKQRKMQEEAIGKEAPYVKGDLPGPMPIEQTEALEALQRAKEKFKRTTRPPESKRTTRPPNLEEGIKTEIEMDRSRREEEALRKAKSEIHNYMVEKGEGPLVGMSITTAIREMGGEHVANFMARNDPQTWFEFMKSKLWIQSVGMAPERRSEFIEEGMAKERDRVAKIHGVKAPDMMTEQELKAKPKSKIEIEQEQEAKIKKETQEESKNKYKKEVQYYSTQWKMPEGPFAGRTINEIMTPRSEEDEQKGDEWDRFRLMKYLFENHFNPGEGFEGNELEAYNEYVGAAKAGALYDQYLRFSDKFTDDDIKIMQEMSINRPPKTMKESKKYLARLLGEKRERGLISEDEFDKQLLALGHIEKELTPEEIVKAGAYMKRISKAGPGPNAYNKPDKTYRDDPDYIPHNMQPSRTQTRFCVTRMYSTSSSQDAGYAIIELAWDPDKFEGMSTQNIQHQIISYIKGLESDKYFHDFGVMGKPKLMEMDRDAGVAQIKVRCSNTRGLVSLNYTDSDHDINTNPIHGLR